MDFRIQLLLWQTSTLPVPITHHQSMHNQLWPHPLSCPASLCSLYATPNPPNGLKGIVCNGDQETTRQHVRSATRDPMMEYIAVVAATSMPMVAAQALSASSVRPLSMPIRCELHSCAALPVYCIPTVATSGQQAPSKRSKACCGSSTGMASSIRCRMMLAIT